MFTSYYSGKMNSDTLNRKTHLKLRLHRLIIIAVIKHREEIESVYYWNWGKNI